MPISPLNRRNFLKASGAAVTVALAPRGLRAATAKPNAYSFILLGDIHYDRPEHHDMAWVKKELPNIFSSIAGFCQKTKEILPPLFATVRQTVADLNRNPDTRVAFVLQVGDVVQGACGSAELAARQNSDALQFVRDAQLGAPFIFTKGNHDISGAGATEAFARVFHPFLTEQTRALNADATAVTTGRYIVEHANSQFVFFDAYEPTTSLEWFEAVAVRRTAEHFFVVVHPPVVPYGARSNWTIFSSDKDRPKREKMMDILGRQHGLVLSGHLHRYSSLGRQTPGGRFAQFALSSIVYNLDVQPVLERSGLKDYNGDLVNVEPKFSPDTEQLRRALFEAERPGITSFEFADLPGYAVVTVDGARVQIDMYSGVGRKLYRRVDFTGLLG
ncbi:MAG TPA: metallophosphoesterase [Opitutaceae bacterium]|nr:metallophosphoesterase [Opitutaceae bacterium]